MGKKLGPYKQAVKDAVDAANAKRIEKDGLVTHEYPDYETYRAVQIAGNKAKLRMQFVKESHIEALAEYLNKTNKTTSFGLCHGTRRGLEQEWFNKHLNGTPEVIGTEISDTANQFENSIQWDFHEENADWEERADFVYSNSWDHAFDPNKAFSAWAKSLKPGGFMLLDHTKGQTPEAANALDPFGATIEALCNILNDHLSEQGEIIEIIDRQKERDYRAKVVVWRRNA